MSFAIRPAFGPIGHWLALERPTQRTFAREQSIRAEVARVQPHRVVLITDQDDSTLLRRERAEQALTLFPRTRAEVQHHATGRVGHERLYGEGL